MHINSNVLDIIISMRQIIVIMKHVIRTVVSETAKVTCTLLIKKVQK